VVVQLLTFEIVQEYDDLGRVRRHPRPLPRDRRRRRNPACKLCTAAHMHTLCLAPTMVQQKQWFSFCHLW
jgi:hypothetical protein